MANKEKQNNDEDLIICRCEEITKKEILEAIADGARDLRGIRIRTRAGMGLCQGRSCERLIRKILAEELKMNPQHFPPATRRPPVRPLELELLGRDDNDIQ